MNLFFPILLLCYIQTVTSKSCFWNTECPYKYFSDITSYSTVRGDIRDSLVKFNDCQPISIWGLIRHGKKNPDTELIKYLKEAVVIRDHVTSSYNSGNSSLCAQDVENLRNWIDEIGMFDKPYKLTPEGYQEVQGIGRRFSQTFPELLERLEKDEYVIHHSDGIWMSESAQGFIDGLKNKQLTVQPYNPDFDVVSPYDNCTKFIIWERTPSTYAELVKYYQTSSEYLASKEKIQRRLGINYPLSNANISALYNLCHHSSLGLSKKSSPWCALFTTEDLEIMEYASDLRHYYRSGYGTPINKLFGQITLADLLRNFQAAKKGNGKKIVSYISHATIMNMVYTALDLFKDDIPLTGTERNPNRKWRSSKIISHASNLIAVLNKCKKGGKDDYNVVFYLNEEPLISICKQGVCTWEEFENKLMPFLETKLDFC